MGHDGRCSTLCHILCYGGALIIVSYEQRSRIKTHKGVNNTEQNGFGIGPSDGNDPTFEVDHLATYTSKSGTINPEDGLRKLKQMESSTGIWAMRCLLRVGRRDIVVIDKGTGDELERFPLSHVQKPIAVIKNDRRETYNNLVLFTVTGDLRQTNGTSDMDIYQSVHRPAQTIVDKILAAKGEGGSRRGQHERPPPTNGSILEVPHTKSRK